MCTIFSPSIYVWSCTNFLLSSTSITRYLPLVSYALEASLWTHLSDGIHHGLMVRRIHHSWRNMMVMKKSEIPQPILWIFFRSYIERDQWSLSSWVTLVPRDLSPPASSEPHPLHWMRWFFPTTQQIRPVFVPSKARLFLRYAPCTSLSCRVWCLASTPCIIKEISVVQRISSVLLRIRSYWWPGKL